VTILFFLVIYHFKKWFFYIIFGDYPLLYTWCPFLLLLWPFSVIIDFLHIMYQTNSIIHTCTNLNLAFPFFEFRPRVQNPVPTFKPSSHPITTKFSAIIIGNPHRPCSFLPALFLPLSFCYQQPPDKMPLVENVTCPLFPIGPAALDHVPCHKRQNRDNVLFVISVTSWLSAPLICW
jgi:hypothetical protein